MANDDLVGYAFTDEKGRTLIVTGTSGLEQYVNCETEDGSYKTVRLASMLRERRLKNAAV